MTESTTVERTAAIAKAPDRERQVGRVRRAVAELFEKEQTWSSKKQELEAELAQFGPESGDAVLAASLAGDGDDALRVQALRVSVLRAELEVHDRTIDAARRQRALAIAAVYAAEAAEIRAKAPALQAEIAARTSKTDELLAALKAHEGVEYVPYRPPERVMGGGIYSDPVSWDIPRTEALQAQLREIERQALAAERRPVISDGQAVASSIDELVTLATSEPTMIGPTITAARGWAEAAQKIELARRARIRGAAWDEEWPLRYTLVWHDGAIVPPRRDGSGSSVTTVTPFRPTGQVPAFGRVRRRSENADD